jgi:Protein of unknown function (DUF4244)
MNVIAIRIHVALVGLAIRWQLRSRTRGDRGQATAEYALVLLGAALIGLLVVGWATAGGGAGKIGRLLDRVFDAVTRRVT